MHVRLAAEAEVPSIVRLILGGQVTPSRERAPEARCYLDAFREIQASPHSAIYVAEHEGRLAGTFMLTFLRHLMRRGTLVAQLEAVHVAAELRSRGIGTGMVRWAIDEARRRGCSRVQLTSNAKRTDAHRFYERLGFVRSHVGMKLELVEPDERGAPPGVQRGSRSR